ncbi:MAG: ATP-grasp domain-containing protein [Gammaproteobacteria bacterium]|nr:ATP-grasp domain-containing protein [Gammaproteobacteria bacterium]
MKRLNRMLICNRGEIAIRIAEAAASLGMETVSIYAAIDRTSRHTSVTTKSVQIAAVDGVAAYLDIEAVLDVAKTEACDCVHPGYGFLAENALFAERCQEEGIVFVGPGPSALTLFGDKVRARDLARKLNVPLVPGSETELYSLTDAVDAADQIGYPVMLKATAGGGGRGIRRVESHDELANAFERCRSEAASAFGDGTLFMEKLVVGPRHIEVQVLADSQGETIHLYERDCSVQIRNQKVIEVAPAFSLTDELRVKLHQDAVELVKGAGYVNAGTVEFLVDPDTSEYYFIECNPRIQVEHTVTEEVLGIDLIEAQIEIANGRSLKELGLLECKPTGYAIQARIVVEGSGTITAYKEPAGRGVRVDSCGFQGYAPSPQFDPLVAKLICRSNSRGTLASAVERSLRALEAFQITGLPTNLASLHAILSRPEIREGAARTTMLENNPQLLSAPPLAGLCTQFLDQQSKRIIGGPVSTQGVKGLPELSFDEACEVVECPMDSVVLEMMVSENDDVIKGDVICVVTAMKMETNITSPVSGRILALQQISAGDSVALGSVIAAVMPGAVDTKQGTETGAGAWREVLEEVTTLKQMGIDRLGAESNEPGVVRQRIRGKLTCRQRIDLFLDDASFREVGSIAGFASYDAEGGVAAFTPANSVGGWGDVSGRATIVCADDFTSRGGHADGAIGAKSGYLDRLSMEMRIPSVRMLDGSSGGGSVAAMVPQQKKAGDSNAEESTGAIKAGRPRVSGGGGSFLPGHLGSSMYAEQLATVPVVNMLLGSVVGIGAAKAVLGHFSVMVRDISQLFVAGPPVVSHAMGYDITKEDLGGWHIHCTNGAVDNLAESEEEAMDMTRRFLSYLPNSVFEIPPIGSPMDAVDRREEELFNLIPRKRTMTFDVRRAIELIADKGSFFEIGSLWGTDQVTGFVRMNGHPVGVIASDSRHVNGGALTAQGCKKLIRQLDLCDLFNIPVLNLVDNPGFAVGLEHELAATIRKGGEWMVAFSQLSVPVYTVLMRRSFGVAGNNYATPRSRPSMRVSWPAADVGGIPPEGGIEAAYKRQLAEAEDPAALRAELEERIESARGPVGPLNKFQIEEVIDPRDTRRMICDWVTLAYKVISQPDQLVKRNLQFRP